MQKNTTHRNSLLIGWLLLTALCNLAYGSKRPNVLFIAIDDLRPELGCYGAKQIKTPHIDKLAAQGMRFNRAYCQVPICMGSRASLMTSILPTPQRFAGNCVVDEDTPGAVTMPETFRKAGYTTISNGKIFHHKNDTAPRSWSEPPWTPDIGHMHSHDPETTRRLSKTKNRGRIFEAPDIADDGYVDKLTGDILAELKRLELEKNTIVVIWSDHGWHLGEHNFWGKHNTMHLATRVPLIIRVPGKPRGVTPSLVEVLDIYPTLCELADIEVPASVQGKSFRHLFDEPDAPFRDAAYSRFNTADSIITEHFTYTKYSNGGDEMLYDLENDPSENRNIAVQPHQKKTIAEMRSLLKERQAEARSLK